MSEITTDDLEKCVSWTKNYISNSPAKGVLVGLSGGVDSAVVAAICAEAIGQQNVLGVIMPCDSGITDEMFAEKVSIEIGFTSLIIPLDDMFNTWWKTYRATMDFVIKQTEAPDYNRMTKANAKARFRMTTLYALANQLNFLVAGTTNKSESLIGYFTKYGDGAADFEPILDFYKTEVFELAKILYIPEKIINRPPSAGEYAGQTDEKELELSYEKLDEILKHRWSCQNYRPSITTSRILKRIQDNKHKSITTSYYKRN